MVHQSSFSQDENGNLVIHNVVMLSRAMIREANKDKFDFKKVSVKVAEKDGGISPGPEAEFHVDVVIPAK